MSLNMITITGTVDKPNGSRESGSIMFQLLNTVTDPANDTIVAPDKAVAVLDNGEITDGQGGPFKLTQDPNGEGYTVTESWSGGRKYTTSLQNVAGSTVSYQTLPEAVIPGGVSLYATQSALTDEITRAEGVEATKAATTYVDTADVARLKPRGAWVTATAYAVNDSVVANGTAWRCVSAHTSGASFTADPAKWERFGAAQVLATAPPSPATGDLWYDTSTDLLKRYTGSAWVAAGSGAYLSVGPTSLDVNNYASLQAAHDALPSGGGLLWVTRPQTLTAPLTISKSLKMRGLGAFPVAGSQGTNGLAITGIPTAINGTTITQVTAATDIVQITQPGLKVDFEDIALQFDSPIRYVNTGYGINATPPVVGSNYDAGLVHHSWRNVWVWGTDVNHYGVKMVNPLLGTIDHLRVVGGGGVWIENNTPYSKNYGNMLFNHLFVAVCVGGASQVGHALVLRQINNLLNLMTFVRPQLMVRDYTGNGFSVPAGAVAPTSNQFLLHASGGSGAVGMVSMVEPDFETNVSSMSSLPTRANGLGSWEIDGGAYGIAPFRGATRSPVTNVSANYSMSQPGNGQAGGDRTVLVTTGASGVTITLPLTASCAGVVVTVKKVDSGAGAVTISPTSGTVDGAASFSLATQYKYVNLMCDGTNWFNVGSN